MVVWQPQAFLGGDMESAPTPCNDPEGFSLVLPTHGCGSRKPSRADMESALCRVRVDACNDPEGFSL